MTEVACALTIIRKEVLRTLARMKALTWNRRSESMTF